MATALAPLVYRKYMSLATVSNVLSDCEGECREEVRAFIENCEMIVSIVAPEDQQRLLELIKSKLVGKAESMAMVSEMDSWEELREHLKEVFATDLTLSQWQAALIDCQQRAGESVASYANRFRDLLYNLVHASIYGKSPEVTVEITNVLQIQALHVFINGLFEPLKSSLVSHGPDTVECAMVLACAEEEERPPSPQPMRCTHCRKFGHLVSNCYNKHPHLRVSCTFCGRVGHLAANCFKRAAAQPESALTAQSNECNICYENPIDSVLYRCGHMCMCYDCASRQQRSDVAGGGGGGECPLCRAPIVDIIKFYR